MSFVDPGLTHDLADAASRHGDTAYEFTLTGPDGRRTRLPDRATATSNDPAGNSNSRNARLFRWTTIYPT